MSISIGVCKYIEVKFIPNSLFTQPNCNAPIEDSNTFYRIVYGSFNNRVYAEEVIEELKSSEYDAFIDIFNKN